MTAIPRGYTPRKSASVAGWRGAGSCAARVANDVVMDVWWIGGTKSSTYIDEAVRVRTTLADAAKRYDWSEVFAVLGDHPKYVNSSRLDGPSWYAPLP
jgi:hypothetical protein